MKRNIFTNLKLFTLVLTLFLGFSKENLAQLEGANWYFGTYAGLDFSNGNPTPLFDGQLSTSEGCASVSNNNGDLLFYTDGMFVYNKNHNQMPNGSGLHGNPSSTQSAVICPKPGTWNPSMGQYNGYIICTIDYGQGTNGISWSEVDMLANGGDGEVVASTKNTHLTGTNTVEGANFTVQENGCDYWLITKQIDTDTWEVFSVTSTGVSSTPVISNVGPSTPISYGSIKASPDSKTVSIANGNSGLHVYDIDRLTGQLTHRYSDQTFTSQCYSLEYSPNASYLYFTRLSDPNIYQYDLNTTTQADFIASRTVSASTTNTAHHYLLGTLQLAPDGKIYLALPGSGSLGVINSPNAHGVSSNYTDLAIDITGTNTNGSSTGVYLGLPSFPNFFLQDEKSIQFSQICGTTNINFTLSSYNDLYNQFWYVTPTGDNYPATPNSSDSLFNTTLTPGFYDIKVILDYNCYTDSSIRTIEITPPNDQLELGSDTCLVSDFALDAGNNYDMYRWQDSSSNSIFQVTQPGTYWCEAGTFGVNLVLNGDFEEGNIGFTSDYIYDAPGTTLGGPGHHTVHTAVPNGWWANCGDHTSGSGNMIIADGANDNNDGVPEQAPIWCQSISINTNTDYAFSTWLLNANGSGNTSTLGFFIDGVQIDSTLNTPVGGNCNWDQFYVIWNSGNNTEIEVCIKEMSGEQPGNDFAIDDIRFQPICYSSDTIVVNPIPTASINGDTTICQGASSPTVTFTGTGGTSPYTFTYSLNGETQTIVSTGNTATIQVPTDSSGTFIYEMSEVQDSSATVCSQVQTGTATFVVNPLPTATVDEDIAVCKDDPEPTITFTGANGTPPYIFSYTIDGGPVQTLTSIGNSATIQVPTNAVGTFVYKLVGIEGSSTTNCSQNQTDSVTVIINPLPTASISGTNTVCQNDEPPFVTFTGSNGTPPYIFSYSFNGGAQQTITSSGNTATISVPTNNTGTFEYDLTSVEDNSASGCMQNQTGTATITVSPIPDLSFTANPKVGEPVLNVNFFNNPTNLVENYWDFDDGSGSSEINDTISHSFTALGEYLVTHSGSNEAGCESLDTLTIILEFGDVVYNIPNIVTPNDDGVNDRFYITYLKAFATITNFEFVIFNRWGNIINKFEEPAFTWDGRNQSEKAVSDGTYFYKVNFSTIKGKDYQAHGHIQVVSE